MNSLGILQKMWEFKLELSFFHPTVGNSTNRLERVNGETNFHQLCENYLMVWIHRQLNGKNENYGNYGNDGNDGINKKIPFFPFFP